MRAIPRLYLGTMTFGWSQTSSKVDSPTALLMLEHFLEFNRKSNIKGPHYIDTARIYAGGKTEAIVGEVVAAVAKGSEEELLIGTKAHPSQTDGLSSRGIESQFQKSSAAMGNIGFDEYYLHQPDTEHSLLESLTKLHSMKQSGLIKTIGMSNYHVHEVQRAFELCETHNLTPPSVYQGLYNPLNRVVEKELLPLLRSKGCSFVAYNPLAAGLLTGKHTSVNVVQKGRFKNNENYLPRFYTEANFRAIDIIRRACDEEEISMIEATFRWLLCHSSLGDNDGVLLGASSVDQLDQNLKACDAAREKGPLSENLLRAFDEAWNITENSAFPYWRSYSLDMPNRENLDQGASYEAKKK